jgi:hypothetical protein
MQTHDMVEKIRIFYDGIEVPGLVKYGGITIEEGTIEVPEFQKKRNITDGIDKMPIPELTYKLARDTNTLQFFRSYKENKEEHNVIILRCDRDGKEFARQIWPATACSSVTDPPADMAAPTYAQISIKLVPWDIKKIAAEA